ncbi:Beta-barrel assembly-enhancing protease [bacterium HR19]|nr:Beta-barrel assembly-enhancing protease [bacterium HR19]
MMVEEVKKIQELIKSGNLDDAIEIAEKSFKKTKDERIYNLYGIALFKKGYFEKASEVFGELYSKHPENLNLFLNLARSLLEAGKIEEAERTLREGAMLFYENEKVMELLNECEKRKKEKEETKKAEPKEEIKEEIEEMPKEEIEEVKEEKKAEPETIEEIEEKIEEIKEELEGLAEKPQEKEIEEKIKEKFREREDEEIYEIGELKDYGLLKRGRFLDISLKGESEIILRETFIIFISGSYKILPLKKVRNWKTEKDLFGGKNHKFIKIRGTNCEISVNAEYISGFELQEEERAFILEPFLVGFDPSFKYNSREVNKKVEIVELSGKGKIFIFTHGKKAVVKSLSGDTKVTASNLIGAIGDLRISFSLDSFDIRGTGKVILRI